MRKKAKYLHDAPNEALMPGVGGQNLFNHAAALRNNMAIQNAEAAQQDAGQFYPNTQPFSTFPPARSMPPPMMQENTIDAQNFIPQSALSPPFTLSGQPPLQSPAIAPSPADPTTGLNSNWDGSFFDANDPAFFNNFDIASMNFGNRYGALEFGMLGHMATGAGEPPSSDSASQRGSTSQANGPTPYPLPLGSFSESPTQQFAYNDAVMSDWPGNANVYGQPFSQSSDAPHAFAIEMSAANFTSPDSTSSPRQGITKLEDSPTATYKTPNVPTTALPHLSHAQPASHAQSHPRQSPHISTPQLKAKSQLPSKHTKRPRDPSSIYNNVTAPYSYTSGFHSLIAYLQRRFAASPSKTLTIAKSLASIRPSFIATTKTLNRDDLIFMEKCFQRTLWEYEGFIEGVGTPTIVARRTGEIAAVGKEFSILTGWKKDVLLGREPNLNVNRGGTSIGSAAGSGTSTANLGRGTGRNTPSQRGVVAPPVSEDASPDGKRLQPVFLAELLDDESVVEFYEGFARLAFGDSRGSVMGKGKLLKYRTKEDIVAQNLKEESAATGGEAKMEDVQQQQAHSGHSKRISSSAMRQQRELKRGGIANEREMGQRLGERDGKVECTICWTVKRDVFDIPMLIVMNASTLVPCLECLASE